MRWRLGQAKSKGTAEREAHDHDTVAPDAGVEVAHREAGIGKVPHPVHVVVTLGKRAARRRAPMVEADHRRALRHPRVCRLQHVPAGLAAREPWHQDDGWRRRAPRMEASDEAIAALVTEGNLDALA